MPIIRYCIAKAYTIELLCIEVEKCIALGWQPLGGFVRLSIKVDGSEVKAAYGQTMVYYAPEKKP